MLVGDEIVGFTTATLGAARTYTLSGLYRGLCDTQYACTRHVASEKCVLLDPSAGAFVPLPIGYRTQSLYYKSVPAYGDVAAYGHFSRAWMAENVKPTRPYDVEAETSGDDVVIKWKRNSRHPRAPLTQGGPTDEVAISFRLAIFEPGGLAGAALRLVDVTFDPGEDCEFAYTASMQDDDGRGSAIGDPVAVRLAQKGGLVEVGRFVEVDPIG
jgi:hypothetical protein